MNLHLGRLLVRRAGVSGAPTSVYHTVSVGAPADHTMKFKGGGLGTLSGRLAVLSAARRRSSAQGVRVAFARVRDHEDVRMTINVCTRVYVCACTRTHVYTSVRVYTRGRVDVSKTSSVCTRSYAHTCVRVYVCTRGRVDV